MQRKRNRRRKKPNPLDKLKTSFGKIGTLNIVLIVVGTFFIWFNWQMILLFRECGSMPETYACAVIAATIGECGICGWIRTNKDQKREHDWEKEQNEHNGEADDELPMIDTSDSQEEQEE